MSSYEPLQPAAQTPAAQEPAQQQGPSRSAAFARKLAPLVIVATLLIIFIIQNDGETTVKFLAWDWEIRVAWALLISAVAGYIVGWLALTVWRHRRNR